MELQGNIYLLDLISTRYMAPEIFTAKGYTEKVDIFSLGILLFTLINGTPPFKGKDLKTLIKSTC